MLSKRLLFLCCFGFAALAFAQGESERQRLLELLELKPGSVVAEIGAGSGEMTLAAAERAGTSGRVYANEISEKSLAEIRKVVAGKGLENVTVVKGTDSDTALPEACCDAIFLRDVYHHLKDPAAMNASIFRSLRPGGLLAIIDFRAGRGSNLPDGVNPNRGGHGITPEMLGEELAAAGFEPVRTVDTWQGKWSYCLLVRKPAVKPEKSKTT